MKKLLLLTIALFVGLFVVAQEESPALKYLNAISTQQTLISQDLWDYTCSAAQGKGARKIENKRKELLRTINFTKQKMQAMQPFDGSTTLRDSTVAYLEVSYLVIGEDYAKLVDMQEVSEQSYDAMEAYLLAQEKANEKLDIAFDIFQKEYEGFAAANSITLLEDKSKLTAKLNKASDVYKYYNPVYLIFFKAFKQELYMMDALAKKDVNGVEQNRQTLVKFAEEGVAKLKEIAPYKGDASLKNAANANMSFYIDEAAKVGAMVDYFMKEEAMAQAKKTFESKKTKTQADVDAFNKAVNEINKAVNDYNTLNNTLNKRRADLLDKWNSSCSNFTKSHVPKR